MCAAKHGMIGGNVKSRCLPAPVPPPPPPAQKLMFFWGFFADFRFGYLKSPATDWQQFNITNSVVTVDFTPMWVLTLLKMRIFTFCLLLCSGTVE